MSNLTGILLAAGASRRFGANKLTQTLPNGLPIAVQACLNLKAVCEQVLVVVCPDSDILQRQLSPLGVDVIICQDASQGMGASLAYAIRSRPKAYAWLVALADMPGIRPATMRRVIDALTGGERLVAPQFDGRRGHPVGFSADFRDELMALHGDSGAKSVLQSHAEALRLLDCDDPGILWDIDQPEDLLKFASCR